MSQVQGGRKYRRPNCDSIGNISLNARLYRKLPLWDCSRETRQQMERVPLCCFNLERATGIEPVSEAWEASILPLYDARVCGLRHNYTQLPDNQLDRNSVVAGL
jgi:hypothetical protein